MDWNKWYELKYTSNIYKGSWRDREHILFCPSLKFLQVRHPRSTPLNDFFLFQECPLQPLQCSNSYTTIMCFETREEPGPWDGRNLRADSYHMYLLERESRNLPLSTPCVTSEWLCAVHPWPPAGYVRVRELFSFVLTFQSPFMTPFNIETIVKP